MKKIITTIFTFLLFSSVFAQQWIQKPNFPGVTRIGASTFSIGKYGFMGSGTDGHGAAYYDFYKWNSTTNTWSTIASYPGNGDNSNTSFAIEGKGYVGLGYAPGGPSTDIWRYDTGTNVWTSMATFPGTARYNAHCFVLGHKAYLVSGSTGSSPYLNDVWMYDAHQNSWTKMNNSPAGNEDCVAAFAIGNHGYIAGGWDGTNTHNGAWEYDSTNDTWTAIASAPVSFYEDKAFAIGSKGYVCTGTLNNSNSTELQYGYAYDTVSKAWSVFTNMGNYRIERQGATSFVIGNVGYIGTGIDSLGNNLNTFWAFSPDDFLSVNNISNVSTEQINLYPNPVSQTLNIKFNQVRTENTSIRIMDVTGRVIMSTSNVNAHDDISTINVSALSAGVYFIGISNAETQQTIKFVKE